MTPSEFLHTLWPSSGFYCLATPFKTKDGNTAYTHRVFRDIDAAAKYAESVMATTDVFFAIHTLKEEKVWNKREERWSVRTHANMQEAQTFFFDIDVEADNEKKYPDQKVAISALRDFCKSTGLPRPFIVSSGGGLHIYWPADVSLMSGQWALQAAKLKALAHHYGLKVDPARTTDVSSVLRVSGTFNHKKAQPRPVDVMMEGKVTPLDDLIKIIGDAADAAKVVVDTPKVATSTEDDELYGEGNLKKDHGPPPKIEDLASVCGHVARFVAVRGNIPEPEWREAIRIGKACEGGAELIHTLSDAYPTYDREATIRKAEGLVGVSKCENLRRTCGTEFCGDCQFFTKGLSPISKFRQLRNDPPPTVALELGGQVFVQEIPEAPPGYMRRDGQIWAERTDKNGETFTYQVFDQDLYPIQRLRDDDNQSEEVIWRTHTLLEGIKDFSLEAELYYDNKRLLQELAKRGSIYLNDENSRELRAYMIAYIKHLQSKSKAHAQVNHLGWTIDKSAFVLHDRTINADGSESPASLGGDARAAAQSVGTAGTMAKQIDALNFYARKEYVGQQVMVLSGLASAIFYATGQHGIIVNATGEPGASKSSSMMMAASLWGHPETYPITGLRKGATHLGRDKLVSVLSSLPVCVDEITTMDPTEAVEMAYSVTQPRTDKIRLSKEGKLIPVPHRMRSSIMICTANSSLNNLLSQNNNAATAGAMRVVEMFLPKQHIHEKFEFEAIFRQLTENYGWVGPAFIREWIKHREFYENRVREVMKELDIAAKIQSGERFWSAKMAAVIVACEIANKLGLLAYDVVYLRHWYLTHLLPQMRGVIASEFSTPLSLLTDYLETIADHIIITDEKPSVHSIPVQPPRGAMLGHYDKYSGQLHLLKKGFRDYCAKLQANPSKIIDELWNSKPTDDGVQKRIITAKSAKKTLGAGTDFAKSQSWCITLDMSHPELACAVEPHITPGPVEIVSTPPETQKKSPPRGQLAAVTPDLVAQLTGIKVKKD